MRFKRPPIPAPVPLSPGFGVRDPAWWEYSQQTTPLPSPSVESVTVTHPHHPLYGQRVAVIRVRRGVDPDLIVRLPDGFHGAIAASWTDYAGGAHLPVAGPEESSIAPPLLDPVGLARIAEFVARRRAHGPVGERTDQVC